MRIIRVFPRRTSLTPTDDLAFVGDPPMMRPVADEVHVSCTFTWDKKRAERLGMAWGQYYPTFIGGPAFGGMSEAFVTGRYVKAGVVFTSSGCDNRCPWCLVPCREGQLREYRLFPVGHIIQDNNLLQCSRPHLERVFGMLKGQRSIEFSGGLDARQVTEWVGEQIRTLRIRQVFLACDTDGGLGPLRKAVKTLGLPRQKTRCYVLCAFNGQTIDEAEGRLREVWHAGCMPFAQLYQPDDQWIKYPKEWRDLARTWSRPAAMVVHMRGVV
jgi:hypothetical protein